MRIIPFKILILSLLLPPVLYLITVASVENYLHDRFEKEVTNIYLADINNILNGLVNIRDAIENSITNYLKHNLFLRLGGVLDVSITTSNGNILYPNTYQNPILQDFPTDPVKLAENNFKTLNDGIEVNVGVKISHYSFLAISLLLFYILLFLTGLVGYFQKVSRRLQIQEANKNEELARLQELENIRLKEIDSLSVERNLLITEYEELQVNYDKEKSQAEKTEEDLFDEIEILENKLQEIENLKIKIQELEKRQNHLKKQKDKAIEKLEKRFKTLYKNIEISNKALTSFLEMPEEMSLKAEELILQLNIDASVVPVKRKVFSKKGKITSFEVVFAYNGRLYFRKSKKNHIEILTIGSKNTQQKDLKYIDNL
jgi:hypothetical protein